MATYYYKITYRNCRCSATSGGGQLTFTSGETFSVSTATISYSATVDDGFKFPDNQTTISGTLSGSTVETKPTTVILLPMAQEKVIEKIKVGNNNYNIRDSSALHAGEGTEVSVSGTGTATNIVHYITIDGAESKLPEGVSYTQGDGIGISGNTISVNSSVVRTSGNQTIEGTKTFSSAVVSSVAPTDNNHLANKAYVDTKSVVSGIASGNDWTSLTINGTTHNLPTGGGGSTPTNMVTTDTVQTITADKTFEYSSLHFEDTQAGAEVTFGFSDQSIFGITTNCDSLAIENSDLLRLNGAGSLDLGGGSINLTADDGVSVYGGTGYMDMSADSGVTVKTADNSASIDLSDSYISIYSGGDLWAGAADNVTLEGDALTLGGTSSVTISGATIGINSDSTLTLDGPDGVQINGELHISHDSSRFDVSLAPEASGDMRITFGNSSAVKIPMQAVGTTATVATSSDLSNCVKTSGNQTISGTKTFSTSVATSQLRATTASGTLSICTSSSYGKTVNIGGHGVDVYLYNPDGSSISVGHIINGIDHCFRGDTTYVTMADGSLKPLKDVKKGDMVVGIDVNTGKPITTVVLRNSNTGSRHSYDLFAFENGRTLDVSIGDGDYFVCENNNKETETGVNYKVMHTGKLYDESCINPISDRTKIITYDNNDFGTTQIATVRRYVKNPELADAYWIMTANGTCIVNGVVKGEYIHRIHKHLTERYPNIPENIKGILYDACRNQFELDDSLDNDRLSPEELALSRIISDNEGLICKQKAYLTATDYKTSKWVEGQITDEEFAEAKAARAEARNKIDVAEAIVKEKTEELHTVNPLLDQNYRFKVERKYYVDGQAILNAHLEDFKTWIADELAEEAKAEEPTETLEQPVEE